LRPRLIRAATEAGVLPDVIERDYVISYILAALASHPVLRDTLAFKGGTALRKLFFPGYRFSEDLDFSACRSAEGQECPRREELERTLHEIVGRAIQEFADYGRFNAHLDRMPHRSPHPAGQEDFRVSVWMPWHNTRANASVTCKIEITFDEPLVLNPAKRMLIHGYDERLIASVQVLGYRLEEIVVEKMRALLQVHQKLVEEQRLRTRPRDYYDLWRILGEFGDELERERLSDLLRRKCEHRNVSFSRLEDFLPDETVVEVRGGWQNSLGKFVRDIPAFEQVLDDLRRLIPRFFPGLA
jgi:predicted nucleotidyltransferase component of viral defense system